MVNATQERIIAEVKRRLADGSITQAQHDDFMARIAVMPVAQPTPTAIAAQFDAVAPALDQLAARWSDEQEYEDFADYQKAAISKFPAPFVVKSVSRRPFAVSFTHPSDNNLWTIKVGRKISLSSKHRGTRKCLV